MRRIGRHCLAWTALALFGVTSLLGEGLHLLSGQHHECCAPPLRPHTACDHHAGCCDSHRPDEPATPRPAFQADVDSRHDSSACSICQFFAQAKARIAPRALDLACQLVIDSRFAEPVRTSSDAPLAYRSRGPPAQRTISLIAPPPPLA